MAEDWENKPADAPEGDMGGDDAGTGAVPAPDATPMGGDAPAAPAGDTSMGGDDADGGMGHEDGMGGDDMGAEDPNKPAV